MTGLWLASRNAISSFPFPFLLFLYVSTCLCLYPICVCVCQVTWGYAWAHEHGMLWGVQKRILSIGPCLPPSSRQNFLFYSCIHQANWQLSFRGCPVSASCLIIGTLEWETHATILWSTVALAWQTPYLYPQVLYFFSLQQSLMELNVLL